MKIDIINTIRAINPNAVVNVSADDINQIEWLENTPVIANDIILARQIELQTEEDNKIAQQESKKQSAIAKLKALGLDEEEIVDCPKSGGNLCYKIQVTPEIQNFQSLSCGFWTNSFMKEGHEFYQTQIETLVT